MKNSLPIIGLIAITWLALPTRADEPISTRVTPVESNMHRFMEYMFEASYKRLRTAMKQEPKEKKDWSAIKGDALVLAEACNLLLNRVPEKAKAKSAAWNAISAETREAGKAFYASAIKRDYKLALPQYKMMITKCNACHKQFHGGKPMLAP